MAGYSQRPLVAKLGIKPGSRIAILNAPRGFRASLGGLPEGVTVRATARGPLPFIHFFTDRARVLQSKFAVLARALTPSGALWVSWPKKSAGVPTDLTEDVVRGIGLKAGLVDVKVCAVDDVWSGLKFVRRLNDR
jgi:hypothetical protein